MTTKLNTTILLLERIEQSIWLMRGQKVMLDVDLAELYGIETKKLNQAVKRNIERFPEDFMFQLNDEEADSLRSQFVTSKNENINNQSVGDLMFQTGTSKGKGGRRYNPYVFTEQGVAMLSGILNSQRAVDVNIAIMRAFVKMRGFLQSQELMKRDIDALKLQYDDHDEQIKAIVIPLTFFHLLQMISSSLMYVSYTSLASDHFRWRGKR